MVDFWGADGVRYALAYSDLHSVILPSTTTIQLRFREHEVTVRGRNLAPVYQDLVAHRVTAVREDDFDVVAETDTFVESVTIEPITS